MTRRWTMGGAPDAAMLDELSQVLIGSGVAILPTDTIYGLHARADDEQAVQRIVSIKHRDESKPFIILGSSIEQLEQAGACFSDEARRVVNQLWPGPLTAIVELTRPIAAARGVATVAVRVPDLEWLRSLLERTGPLASTSVNRSGEQPIESIADVQSGTQKLVEAIVDAGPLKGKPSALVDFTGAEPRFIREGERLFTQKVWKTLRKSL